MVSIAKNTCSIIGNLKKDDFIDFLEAAGLQPVLESGTTILPISSKLLRWVDDDTLALAAGSDLNKDEQINAVVDGVHWHIQAKGMAGKLTIMVGKRRDSNAMDEVLNAMGDLVRNLKIPLSVNVLVDGQLKVPESKSEMNTRSWLSQINDRDEKTPPKVALNLSELVNDNSFRWYRTVAGDYWSGRIDGLQVCTVSDDGKTCILDVGKTGKNGKNSGARNVFMALTEGKKKHFDGNRLHDVAAMIKRLAESRRKGRLKGYQREHLLESMVLRKKITVSSIAGDLLPVCETYPFQFPTRWSPVGSPRYIDALMHINGVPYVVELKEPTGSSRGAGYRHAITQAVLYREFIRTASDLYPWFESKRLDPKKCQAAVAFPKMGEDPKSRSILNQHKEVAEAFGVEVIELDDFI